MKYACIGHLTIDIIVKEGVLRQSLGGSVAYGTVSSKAYGVNSSLAISKVGYDFPEEYLLFLARHGVDISGVRVSEKPTTKFKLVYRESSRTLYLINYCEPISPEDVYLAMNSDVVHIGPVFKEINTDIIKILKREGVLILLDVQGLLRNVGEEKEVVLTSSQEAWKALKLADVVHLEINEALALTATNKLNDAIEILSKHSSKDKIISITMGEEGSIVISGPSIIRVPSFPPKKIVDTTGSGDVYTAILGIALSEGEDIRSAAALASAASSFLIEEKGPIGVVRKEKLWERAEKVLNNIRDTHL